MTFKRADFRDVRFLGGAVFLVRVGESMLTRAAVSGELTVEALAGNVNASNLRGEGRFSHGCVQRRWTYPGWC